MRYTYLDKPLQVFGIPNFETRKILQRLPEEVLQQVPSLSFLGKRAAGARVCFRTNATSFTVKMQLATMTVDVGMSIYACQSAFVFAGERKNARFLGLVAPESYETLSCEATFEKSPVTEDVTIFLPRNEIVENVEVEIPDGATVESPTPYAYAKPILFYGSSITEGGCSCNVSNAYNAVLSRRLDFDYINFGFSGSARGELPIADYIASLDISAVVLDYDHNAPTVEHLQNTHEAFYRRIRERKPDLPVLMLSKPKVCYDEEDKACRAVIHTTYERAKANGENVYFIDGETFFAGQDADLCLLDGVHPNDLGFYRMALTIEPILKEILLKL